jgi:hypothetical protein
MREYRCLIIGYSSRGRIRSDTKNLRITRTRRDKMAPLARSHRCTYYTLL